MSRGLGDVYKRQVITGIIYFIMTFALSKLFGHFEHKMQRSDRQSGTARQRKSKREGAVA